MSGDPDSERSTTRRTILRKSAIATGALAIGGAAASGNASAQKRGGRAQVSGTVHRNEPFQVQPGGDPMGMNASCMASESATQMYLPYTVEYCGNDDSATLYVIPDEAPLAENEVYEFRAVMECKEGDNQRVAFGPSNQEC